jgi:hypothetical protein
VQTSAANVGSGPNAETFSGPTNRGDLTVVEVDWSEASTFLAISDSQGNVFAEPDCWEADRQGSTITRQKSPRWTPKVEHFENGYDTSKSQTVSNEQVNLNHAHSGVHLAFSMTSKWPRKLEMQVLR